MSDPEVTVEVTAPIPDNEPIAEPVTEVVDEGDTTIVVDNGSSSNDGIHPAIAEFMSEVRVELAALRGDTDNAVTTAADAQATADDTAAVLEEAVNEVLDVADGVGATIAEAAPPITADADEAPTNTKHRWFKR